MADVATADVPFAATNANIATSDGRHRSFRAVEVTGLPPIFGGTIRAGDAGSVQ
jgi:hypothetical protein